MFIANIDDNETIADVLTAPPPAPRGAAGAPPARGRQGWAIAVAHTPAYWLKVSAQRDGTFTLTNPRNGFSKTYRPAN